MRRARAAAAAGAALLILAATAGGGPASGLVLDVPPDGRVYHAAYPDFTDTEDRVRAWRVRRFQETAGKRIAWAYFSNNWKRRIAFPRLAVDRIHAAGSVPFIRIMARSDFEPRGPDERYTLESIAGGGHDVALREWFGGAAAVPFPLLVEFGTEVNGFWFPWNGAWAGGEAGPARFVAAYRHLVELAGEEGADNLTWFFHVNNRSYPRRPWNSIGSYYPGDAYVDWLGVSVYGSLDPAERRFPSFARLLRPAYRRLAALSDEPIAVLEYGTRQGPRKPRWIRNAIRSIARGRFPRVRALAYWNEAFPDGRGGSTDLRIDSDPASRRAYRRGFDRRRLTGRAVFRLRP
jgi:hypothetical protein